MTMRGKRKLAVPLCLVLAAALTIMPLSCSGDEFAAAQAEQKTLTAAEASTLAEAASDGIRQASVDLVKKQIELQQAKEGIRDTRKKESTIRFSLLFNLKFPEKHGLPKEIDLIMSVPEIQMEQQILKRQKLYEGLRSRTAGKKAFYDVLLEQYQIGFYEKRLRESKETAERIRRQYQMGTGAKEDAEYADGVVEEYEKALASSSVTFHRAKEKLGELIGKDVRFSYQFEEKLPELTLLRSDLERASGYAVEQDFGLYEASRKREYAERKVSEILGIYQGKYANYMGAVNFYLNTHEGKQLDYEEFISLYNDALFGMDSPWYGAYVINLIFFKIRIPKEWFKGEYSGTRYLEDQKYALFVALVEREQAEKNEARVKKALLSSLRDSFEVLKQMEKALRDSKDNLTQKEKAYRRALAENQKGLTSFSSLEASKNNLYEQQRSLFEMRVEYAKALENFNEISGGYIEYLLNGSGQGASNEYESGNSFLEEEEDGTSEEKPEWYLMPDTAGYRFTFGVRMPAKYEVDAYELCYNDKVIGERKAIGERLVHLGLSYENTSLLMLKFYRRGQLVYLSYFDGGSYGGELVLTPAEEAVSPFANLEEGTAVGQWSFIAADELFGEFSFGINAYYQYEEYAIYIDSAEVARGKAGEPVKTLKLYFGEPQKLKILLYQQEEHIETMGLLPIEEGEGNVIYLRQTAGSQAAGNGGGSGNTADLEQLFLMAEDMEIKEARPEAAEFPDRTLIIGTYAIALDALSDEIYEVASKSAESSQQNQVYYKSDLTPGVWYNITSAKDIGGISAGGKAVPDREINELLLEYYTKPSGITVRFEEDKEIRVYPSDLENPANPVNLDECAELVKQLEIQQELYKSTKKKVYKSQKESLERTLAALKNRGLNKLTEELHALDDFLVYLIEKGAGQEQKAAVEQKKEEWKKQRLVQGYTLMKTRLKREINTLDFQENAGLLEQYQTSLTSVESALNELDTGAEEQLDALSQISKEAGEEMVAAAKATQYEEAEQKLNRIVAAETLLNGGSTSSGTQASSGTRTSEEVRKMQKELLEEAIKRISEELESQAAEGENEAYRTAKAEGESEEVLEAIKQGQFLGLQQSFAELDFYYEELTNREEEPAAQAALLKEKEQFYTALPMKVQASDLQKELVELLKEQEEKAGTAVGELLLHYSSEYQQASNAAKEAAQALEQLNLKYLDALDAGETEQAAEFLQQRNQAQERVAETEEKIAIIEKEFADGSFIPDLNLEGKENELRRNVLGKKLEQQWKETEGRQLTEGEKAEQEQLLEEWRKLELLHLNEITGLTEFLENITGQPEAVKEAIPEWKYIQKAADLVSESIGRQQEFEEVIATAKDSDEKKQVLLSAQKALKDSIDRAKQLEAEIKDQNMPLAQAAAAGAVRLLEAEYAKLQKRYTQEEQKEMQEQDKLRGDTSLLSEEDAQLAQELAKALTAEEMREKKEAAARLQKEVSDYYQSPAEIILPWNLIFQGLTEKAFTLQTPSVRIKNTILVPAEELIRALGGTVDYSMQNSVILLRSRGTWMEFILENKEVYINDQRMTTTLAPIRLNDGVAYLPLECFEQAYGLKTTQAGVYWISKKLSEDFGG